MCSLYYCRRSKVVDDKSNFIEEMPTTGRMSVDKSLEDLRQKMEQEFQDIKLDLMEVGIFIVIVLINEKYNDDY